MFSHYQFEIFVHYYTQLFKFKTFINCFIPSLESYSRRQQENYHTCYKALSTSVDQLELLQAYRVNR
jgi:hypothetical protein